LVPQKLVAKMGDDGFRTDGGFHDSKDAGMEFVMEIEGARYRAVVGF
jgi:hypothetical protein